LDEGNGNLDAFMMDMNMDLTHRLLPAALASESFGFVLVRVRVQRAGVRELSKGIQSKAAY
jgi:hypothetical protein